MDRTAYDPPRTGDRPALALGEADRRLVEEMPCLDERLRAALAAAPSREPLALSRADWEHLREHVAAGAEHCKSPEVARDLRRIERRIRNEALGIPDGTAG